MKIAIIGAAGVRTPIIVYSMLKRQDSLGLDQLALMDIDPINLGIIGKLTDNICTNEVFHFSIDKTTEAENALKDADYVITTFRVGGMESRVIDEKVPLSLGVLGQETTGPGGFAMGMRSIPILRNYIQLMEELCPNAWLINFANPSGMLAETAISYLHWDKAVGICDGPSSMREAAAKILHIPSQSIYLDYFGLNHLGWVRSAWVNGVDYLPMFLEMLSAGNSDLELPFSTNLLNSLKMVPNEYLYYYYSNKQAVNRILRSEQTRGEQILELNNVLFHDLKQLESAENKEGMEKRYFAYQKERWSTYMKTETGSPKHDFEMSLEEFKKQEQEGYAGVALNLIEALNGSKPQNLILNIQNRGSIHGISDTSVVEIPAYVGHGIVHPLSVGAIPEHCLGMMNLVKSYEKLTIEAALEGSYQKALAALTIHPLVGDEDLARIILDGYVKEHGEYFPALS